MHEIIQSDSHFCSFGSHLYTKNKKIRIGSATSVTRGENLNARLRPLNFVQFFSKRHNLVPMVNCHHQELDQLDWMIFKILWGACYTLMYRL